MARQDAVAGGMCVARPTARNIVKYLEQDKRGLSPGTSLGPDLAMARVGSWKGTS